MAKIALAGGHSKQAAGAVGYLDEYTEDRIINNALIAEMKKRGHTVTNCSNEMTTKRAELAREVQLANNSKADIFQATHFNAYKKTTGCRGVEVWYYEGSELGKKIATRMSKDLAALFDLPNRGAKATTELYVIRNTNMTAILPEVCFVDAKGDADSFRKVTTEQIVKVMADALEYGVGKVKTATKKPVTKPKTETKKEESEETVNIVLTKLKKGSKSTAQVKTLQRLLVSLGYSVGKSGADGIFGADTDTAVKKFQKDKKLEVDGIVGANTWTALLK